MNAWKFHRSSRYASDMNWCAIAPLWSLGALPFNGATSWRDNVAMWVRYWKESNYQRVLDERPLFFILWDQNELGRFDGVRSNVKIVLDEMRHSAREEGVNAPYVAIMYGNVDEGAKIVEEVGADAVTNYIVPPGEQTNLPSGSGEPFSALAEAGQRFWNLQALTGHPVIPIASTGFDNRPTVETPWPGIDASALKSTYWGLPRPRELIAHLHAAKHFILDHPSICESAVLLIYSWSECAEGGNALMPTIGDPPVNRSRGFPIPATTLLMAVRTELRGS